MAASAADGAPRGRRERVELVIKNRNISARDEGLSRWVGPKWATRVQLATNFGSRGRPHDNLRVSVWLDEPELFCFGVRPQLYDRFNVRFEIMVCNTQETASLKKTGKFDFLPRITGGHVYTEWDTSLSVSDIQQPDAGWLNDDGELRVQAVVTFVSDRPPQRAEDFTQQITQVTFQMSEGPPLFFDKRVLVAQSEYFAEMLSNESWREGRTHEVDLRNNPDANHQTVSAVLTFLQKGTFVANGDAAHAISVRRLADQYRLTDLVTEVDHELTTLLSEDNVLTLLRQVVGTGGVLEKCCVKMLRADDWEILEQQKDKLCQLAKDDAALSAKLMELFVEAAGEWRAAKRARTQPQPTEWDDDDWDEWD